TVCLATREWAEANAYAQRAVAMNRALYPAEAYPDGHPELARSLLWAGQVYLRRNDNDKAAQAVREALAMNEKLYPEKEYPQGSEDLANSLMALSTVLEVGRDPAGARDALERLVALKRRQPKPQAALLVNKLAQLNEKAGDAVRAEALYKEAL